MYACHVVFATHHRCVSMKEANALLDSYHAQEDKFRGFLKTKQGPVSKNGSIHVRMYVVVISACSLIWKYCIQDTVGEICPPLKYFSPLPPEMLMCVYYQHLYPLEHCKLVFLGPKNEDTSFIRTLFFHLSKLWFTEHLTLHDISCGVLP